MMAVGSAGGALLAVISMAIMMGPASLTVVFSVGFVCGVGSTLLYSTLGRSYEGSADQPKMSAKGAEEVQRERPEGSPNAASSSPTSSGRKLRKSKSKSRIKRQHSKDKVRVEIPPPPKIAPQPVLQYPLTIWDRIEQREMRTNGTTAYPINNEHFEGKVIFKTFSDPLDPAYKTYFDAFPGRMFEGQIQGKFKKAPTGQVFMGGSVPHPMTLGLMTRGLARLLLRIIQSLCRGLHYSFGDDQSEGNLDAIELPHIVFPIQMAADCFVETAPGEEPPAIGIPEINVEVDPDFKATVVEDFEFKEDYTYTAVFFSPNIDLVGWRVVEVPGAKTMDLHSFWGDMPMVIQCYELLDPEGLHCRNNQRLFFSLELKHDPSVTTQWVTPDTPQTSFRDEQLLLSSDPINVEASDEFSDPYFEISQPESSTVLNSPVSTVKAIVDEVEISVPCWVDRVDAGSSRSTAFLLHVEQRAGGGFDLLRGWSDLAALDKEYRKGKKKTAQLPAKIKSSEDPSKMDAILEEVALYTNQVVMGMSERVDAKMSLALFLREDVDSLQSIPDGMRSRFGGGRLDDVETEGLVLRARGATSWVQEWVQLKRSSLNFYSSSKHPTVEVQLEEILGATVVPLKETNTPYFHDGSFVEVFTEFKVHQFWVPAGRRAALHWASTIAQRTERATRAACVDPRYNLKSDKWGRSSNRLLLNHRRVCFNVPKDTPCVVSASLLAVAMTLTADAPKEQISAFMDGTARLTQLSVKGLPEDEKLAFWLNVYHTLMLHSLLVLGPPTGLLARKKFYDNSSYEVEGVPFSLAEIEHGIIRYPLSPPRIIGSSFLPRKLDGSRVGFALTKADPRVNFALNTGVMACPSLIAVFHPETLDEDLRAVSDTALSYCLEVDSVKRVIALPKIMDWYSNDFARSKTQAARELLRNTHTAIGREAYALFFDGGPTPSVKYTNYNWTMRPTFARFTP